MGKFALILFFLASFCSRFLLRFLKSTTFLVFLAGAELGPGDFFAVKFFWGVYRGLLFADPKRTIPGPLNDFFESDDLFREDIREDLRKLFVDEAFGTDDLFWAAALRGDLRKLVVDGAFESDDLFWAAALRGDLRKLVVDEASGTDDLFWAAAPRGDLRKLWIDWLFEFVYIFFLDKRELLRGENSVFEDLVSPINFLILFCFLSEMALFLCVL